MSNSFFQFKQFTVFQDKCAMKVCTDACLFGALTAHYKHEISNCLDIGTGTGLLSLMFAQKNPDVIIDAVELDTGAADQAKENFASSPWAKRLTLFNMDIRLFNPGKKYDLLIANPPFFENDLRSADETKNNAKHDTSLSLAELLKAVDACLSKDGVLAVLLPYHRVNNFIEETAKQELYLARRVLVKQSMKHDYFRGILFFSRGNGQPVNSEISIKSKEGDYSHEFIEALKDYYLYL